MRKLIVLLAATGAACGGKSNSAPPSPVNGQIIVHTGVSPSSSNFTALWVLLGDGSKFVQQTAGGDVTFKDPSIKGPQTVTMVAVSQSGDVGAFTGVDIDLAEVWMGRTGTATSAGPQGSVSGMVTGFTPGDVVTVTAVGTGYFGSATAASDGSYTVQVSGAAPGNVDLFAQDLDPSGGGVTKVGLFHGAAVSPASPTTNVSIALDHPLDQTFTLSADNATPYGAVADGSLSFYLGSSHLFSSNVQGASLPLALRSISLTPPFDALSLYARVTVGQDTNLPNGQAEAVVYPSHGATSGSVKMLSPLTLASPPLGAQSTPGSTPAAGLELAWTADGAAQVVNLTLRERNTSPSLDWEVMAPARVGRFRYFALPSANGSRSSFQAGTLLRVDSAQAQATSLKSFNDLFGATEFNPTSGSWSNSQARGYVTLQ